MNTETEDRRSTQTPAVDRSDEFDQTRQHIHMERSTCPVPDCTAWPPAVSDQQSAISDRPAVEPFIKCLKCDEPWTPSITDASLCYGEGSHRWPQQKPPTVSDQQSAISDPPHVSPIVDAEYNRGHVSPAVWEYRAKQAEYAAKKEAEENAWLRQNIATLKGVLARRDEQIERLHARIAGFERMTAALAAGVDKAEQMFADLFGARPEAFVREHLATESTEKAA